MCLSGYLPEAQVFMANQQRSWELEEVPGSPQQGLHLLRWCTYFQDSDVFLSPGEALYFQNHFPWWSRDIHTLLFFPFAFHPCTEQGKGLGGYIEKSSAPSHTPWSWRGCCFPKTCTKCRMTLAWCIIQAAQTAQAVGTFIRSLRSILFTSHSIVPMDNPALAGTPLTVALGRPNPRASEKGFACASASQPKQLLLQVHSSTPRPRDLSLQGLNKA